LDHLSLPPEEPAEVVAFKRKAEELGRIQDVTNNALNSSLSELGMMRKAIAKLEQPEEKWLNKIISLEKKLQELKRQLSGDPIKSQLDMDPTPSVSDRIGRVVYESKYSSSQPTGTHRASLAIAEEELKVIAQETRAAIEGDLMMLRKDLEAAGAPYVPNTLPLMK
jgi:hypothetical protein